MTINNIQQRSGFADGASATAYAKYIERTIKIKRRQRFCNACGAAMNRTSPLIECNGCLERDLEFRLNQFENRSRRGGLI